MAFSAQNRMIVENLTLVEKLTRNREKRFVFLLLLLITRCANIEDYQSEQNTATDPVEQFEPFEEEYAVKCMDTVQHESGTAISGFPPEKAYGPPRGSGDNAGSLDVFVLGESGSAVFSAAGFAIKDEAGDDFKVFENGFKTGDGSVISWDLGTVEVSSGGNSADMSTWSWYGWPVTYSGDTNKVAGKSGFAGMNPVIVHETKNRLDPRLAEAGGDGFDLSDARHIDNRGDNNPLNYSYGNSLQVDGITQVSYIRIRDGGSHINDGQAFSNGIDIDAICIFNYTEDQ